MKFEIPLKFEEEYIDFVNKNSDKIYSVYFPVFHLFPLTARIANYPLNESLLKNVDKKIKRKLLLNGRFVSEHFYDKNFIKMLKEFIDEYQIYCCIVTDGYFAKFLDDNDIPIQLSINFGLRKTKDFKFYKNYFKNLVNDFIIDRNMNLNPEIYDEIHAATDCNFIMLANEGCLYNCPFKVSHDIVISYFNRQFYDPIFLLYNNLKELSELHSQYSCVRVLKEKPWIILTSPFVRPEDLTKYPGNIIWKIARREVETEVLKMICESYFKQKCIMNLLSLLDTGSFLENEYWLMSDKISKEYPEFHETRMYCDKDCAECGFCKKVFYNCSQKLMGGEDE